MKIKLLFSELAIFYLYSVKLFKFSLCSGNKRYRYFAQEQNHILFTNKTNGVLALLK